MEVVSRCGLEDEGYGGVSCVYMSARRVSVQTMSARARRQSVLGELKHSFCSLGGIFFLDQQYIPWRGRPSKRKEVIGLCLCECK